METIENIKTDEGYRSEPYLCSAGKLTWLYGRNIEDRPITQEEWEDLKLLLEEGSTIKEWAHDLFMIEIVELEDVVQKRWDIELYHSPEVTSILINMLYNMGESRFNPLKWPKFFKAVRNRNYKKAAEEMKNSRWYRQVGKRSERLYNAMKRQV